MNQWLKDMKAKAAMQKAEGRKPVNYAVTPLRSKYLGNTGMGEDGVLQPNMPTELVRTTQGPRLLHEGEGKFQNPDGSVTVIPQKALARMNVPGYATGGTYNPQTDTQTPDYEKEGYVIPKVIKQPKFEMPTANPFQVAPVQTEQAVVPPPANTGYVKPVRATPPEFTPFELPPIKEQTKTGGEKTEEIETKSDVSKSLEDQQRAGAMGRIAATARGDFSAIDPALQKQLADMKATMDVEQRVAAQQAAQQGLSPEIAAARQAMGRAGARQALAEAEGTIAGQKLSEQAQAARDLAGEARLGQQMELDKERFENTAGWKAYESAIAAGDFETAAGEYQKITGNPINMEQMQRYQDYMNKKQEQDITRGEIDIQSMKTELGDQQFASVLRKVSAGAPYDPSMGISQAQFEEMRKYTSAGIQDYGRSVELANTLLATNEPENIAQAANILSTQTYPGVTFSFDNLISDIGAQRFSTALQNTATLANTFDNWEEARSSAQGLNLINELGGERVAQELFESTKINAIDEEWNEWENSKFYQGLVNGTEDEKRQAESIKTFFTSKYTGELIYDMVPEFTVVDSDGAILKKFDTRDDAEAYSAKHSGTTIRQGDRFQYKDPLTGESTTINVGGGPEPPVGATPGSTMISGDNQVYKVSEDGRTTSPVTYDPANPWSQSATDILRAGPGSDNYQAIVDARAKEISLTGDISKLGDADRQGGVLKAVLTQPDTIKGFGGIESNSKNYYVKNLDNSFDNNQVIAENGTVFKVIGRDKLPGLDNQATGYLNRLPIPGGQTAGRQITEYKVYNVNENTTTTIRVGPDGMTIVPDSTVQGMVG